MSGVRQVRASAKIAPSEAPVRVGVFVNRQPPGGNLNLSFLNIFRLQPDELELKRLIGHKAFGFLIRNFNTSKALRFANQFLHALFYAL